jgi:TPR repeat protein
MFKDLKSCVYLALVCVLTLLPTSASAGGTPEEVKAFKENKAKAEAVAGFGGYPIQSQPGQEFGVTGKPAAEVKVTPGAFVANAYLSGIGVDRDEETALLWYLRVKGQKGLNEEGFRALIRSMPGQQLYALNQLRSEEIRNHYKKQEQVPRVLDQVFKPVWDLRSSSSESGNSFGMIGSDTFIGEASWALSQKLILEEFVRSKGSDELMYTVISCMERFEFKPFSAKVSFTREVSDADKALFEAAAELIKAKVSAVITERSGAGSAKLELVASAYRFGRFGLSADPEQQKRWKGLARDARLSEAKALRAEADSSGPEVWLSVADQIKWASPEVKSVLGDEYSWISRYLEVLTIKAEAGDLPSLNGLVAHYTRLVREGRGLRTSSYERDQLIRWITVRHKVSKSPDDAIVLAHHYNAQNNRNLSMQMAEQYLASLVRKAKEGSLSEMLNVALLSDPNWYENQDDNVVSSSPTEITGLCAEPDHGELYSFRDHARLLKSFGKVGFFDQTYPEGFEKNPFTDPNFNASSISAPVTPRARFVKFVDACVKSEALTGPLLDCPHLSDEFLQVLRYLCEQDRLAAEKYHEVKGGSLDYDVSLRWHRMLAERGETSSMQALAESFEKGQGVTRDAASAYAYCALAGGVSWGDPFSGLKVTYQNAKGTNEQKLDACFKLSPAEKERALKIYNELTSKLVERLNQLAAKGGEQMAKRDLKDIRDYQAQKAAKAKPTKKSR